MKNTMKMKLTTSKQNSMNLTLGLDMGDKHTKFAVLDSEGELVEEGTVRTTPDDFKRVFGRFSEVTMALEVGPHSRWASQTLSELGHLVYVANPRQLKLIYGSTDKDDRLDAERLARLARVDSKLLHPITHRSDDAQADLETLKARDVLVEVRTKLVNHVRAVLKSFGIRVKGRAGDTFPEKVLEVTPESLRSGILALLDTYREVSTKIKSLTKAAERLCEEKYKKETELLQQINGVGPIVSLNFVLRLGNPNRFAKSRTVGAYLGLRPKRSESGSSSPELRVTKAGDSKLRTLLIQSAQYILGHFGKDCDMRRWGLKKAEGGKRAKQRAVVAVARKLSVLMHRLLITGELYDPFRNSQLPQAA